MGEILKKHVKALGSSGTDVVGRVHAADESLSILQGYQAAQLYDKMRRSDDQVIKILSAITGSIRTADWRIEPASDDTKDIEAAALINKILFDDIEWDKFLNECLTCIAHGASVFEVIHANFEDKEFGQYTGLAQLGFRRMATLTEWHHNRITGKLEKVTQNSYSDILTNVDMPVEALMIFYNQQEGDNIGFPLCRGLYGPYKRKLLATELQYIGIERFVIPTPMAKVPKNIKPTDAEYIAAVDVLENFVSAEDSYILYPEGWDVQLSPNTGFDPAKIDVVLKREDENMSGSVLASFLELGVGGNGGAFALGTDLSDFFLNGIQYFANIVKSTINRQLIPQLMKMNYGEEIGVMPKLAYSGIADRAGKELMEVITGYTSGGVIGVDESLEDFVRETHKLPKKMEGTVIDNQETEDDNNEPDPDPEPEPETEVEEVEEIEEDTSLKLADSVGHTHKNTGPAIARGQKHYHNMLDSDGNSVGRTQLEKDGKGHVHSIDGETSTGKAIETKLSAEPKENPKQLIDLQAPMVIKIIRDNLENISSKYIVDVMNNYKRLPDSSKLKAISNVKVGGVNKLKKELKIQLIEASRKSLDMARGEVPSKKDVKLSDEVKDLPNHDTYKFNEFSKLPKRVQLLIANQASLIADKEAKDIADTIAFQFNSSEPSTKDIEVLRKDLQDKANETINAGTTDTVGINATSLIVNEARNSYLLDPQVSEAISSYTFINFDPKSDICKTLASVSFAVNDPDLVRYHPPLHHNAVISGSKIKTLKGYLPIEDICVGDFVATHTGDHCEVYETMDRFEDKHYFEIELDNGNIINITGEHPVLTSRGWVQVDDIRLDDNIICEEDVMND